MIDVHAYYRFQVGQVGERMINELYLASSAKGEALKGGTNGSLCTWSVSDDGMHLWIPHLHSLTKKVRVRLIVVNMTSSVSRPSIGEAGDIVCRSNGQT